MWLNSSVNSILEKNFVFGLLPVNADAKGEDVGDECAAGGELHSRTVAGWR
jgi:hypothetical protein